MAFVKWNHFTKFAALVIAAFTLSPALAAPTPTQQAYIKASNTGVRDEFGRSVAISGDTLVVGAYGEDRNATGVNGNQGNNNANSSGAAYVFVRVGTNWVQQAYLKASNAGGLSPGESEGDWFGFSVAVSGDTIVVGAHGEDSSATDVNGVQNNNSAIGSGAACVFVRDGTNWVQQAYLKASYTRVDDLFGFPVEKRHAVGLRPHAHFAHLLEAVFSGLDDLPSVKGHLEATSFKINAKCVRKNYHRSTFTWRRHSELARGQRLSTLPNRPPNCTRS